MPPLWRKEAREDSVDVLFIKRIGSVFFLWLYGWLEKI